MISQMEVASDVPLWGLLALVARGLWLCSLVTAYVAWQPAFLCLSPHNAPASQPPVLSHAGVPQEAALHEGQRSGKEGKPLILSFTTKPTDTQRFYCAPCFGRLMII
ncbi:hypothetical protein VZT92_013565 [Zoarces viviparus]|uniref:Uncharacterized protein n=1 Tax=Zoarces viviparus TaxID=48416 RepID=A0AAW1F3K6_ZOAVI